jgi:hypothetical protein
MRPRTHWTRILHYNLFAREPAAGDVVPLRRRRTRGARLVRSLAKGALAAGLYAAVFLAAAWIMHMLGVLDAFVARAPDPTVSATAGPASAHGAIVDSTSAGDAPALHAHRRDRSGDSQGGGYADVD